MKLIPTTHYFERAKERFELPGVIAKGILTEAVKFRVNDPEPDKEYYVIHKLNMLLITREGRVLTCVHMAQKPERTNSETITGHLHRTSKFSKYSDKSMYEHHIPKMVEKYTEGSYTTLAPDYQ